MAKAGRKPVTGKARSKTVQVRVTPQELAAWSRAADGRVLADWIREQCNRAAKG
jgi:hypothetical protein